MSKTMTPAKMEKQKIHKGDTYHKDVRFAVIGGKSTDESGQIPSPEARYTHIQFRRFAGCPICDFHLKTFIKRQEEIKQKGVEEIIVFHSTKKEIQIYEKNLPFKVIADANKTLYKSIGVEPSLANFLTWTSLSHIPTVVKQMIKDFRAGERKMPPFMPNGGRFGMPADLLLDQNGQVIAFMYGKHINDQWSIKQLFEIVEGQQ